MTSGIRTMLRLTLLTVVAGALAVSAATVDREALGRTEKMRILVDKVLMASEGWYMTEDHVREIAEAGFNVVSPRIGGNDMARVRRVALLAQKYGIYHMPWMRGTLTAREDAPEGSKLVWASGVEQDLYSPNSYELWDWMTELITGYAKISVDVPSLIGVFLDYENYAPRKQGNCYALSYDTKIMQEFARANGIKLPKLAPAERSAWLNEQGLHEQFREFQINSWRTRCRKLRRAVDAINPRFQFCVYPAPGTLFIKEAVYHEWATPGAPLILADACTYGRPSALLPHEQSLQANRKQLTDNIKFARGTGIPVIYLGGIDPIVAGADPEFCGKNAVMISEVSDGYWVFYEGPNYHKRDHKAYFHEFAQANRAITEGRFDLWRRRRVTRDEYGVTELDRKTDKPQIALYGMKGRMYRLIEGTGEFEVHELRGNSLEYLRQLDVVVLQNYNVSLPADSPFSKTLRRYVEEGGGLMLAHDTAWFMESPFPEVAVRDRPTQNVEAERHVAETDLRIAREHPALGELQPGVTFTPEFRDHMIFKPGPKGTVIIENTFGDPVYVVGEVGKGRVAFVGSYYGYTKPLEGAEREAFLAILNWLARVN